MWNEQQAKEFNDAIDGYLIRRSLVSWTADAAQIAIARADVVAKWVNTGVNIANFTSSVEASARFAEWADLALQASVTPPLERTLKVTVSRTIGADTYTIGLMQTVDVDNPLTLRGHWEEMRQTILSELARISPFQSGSSSSAGNSGAGQGEPDDVFNAERIEVTQTNGKRYFRVFGGRWGKFGVAIWEETLLAAGYPAAMIPDKGIALEGFKAYAKMEGGKPKKITKLAKE